MSAQDDWLGPWESSHLLTLRFPKRRADWRLGRWTAKHAVAYELHLTPSAENLASIEIRPAVSGAPEVFLHHEPANLMVSISHRGGIAACAVGPDGVRLGCDLEIVEPRSDAFVADYFTKEEQVVVRRASADRCALIALIWSAKESALKALHAGLRIDTRSLMVTLDDFDSAILNYAHSQAPDGFVATTGRLQSWRPLRVGYRQKIFNGWWFRSADLLRTEVSLPATQQPVSIQSEIEEHAIYHAPLP